MSANHKKILQRETSSHEIRSLIPWLHLINGNFLTHVDSLLEKYTSIHTCQKLPVVNSISNTNLRFEQQKTSRSLKSWWYFRSIFDVKFQRGWNDLTKRNYVWQQWKAIEGVAQNLHMKTNNNFKTREFCVKICHGGFHIVQEKTVHSIVFVSRCAHFYVSHSNAFFHYSSL